MHGGTRSTGSCTSLDLLTQAQRHAWLDEFRALMIWAASEVDRTVLNTSGRME
ncbi:hypothetical protein TIFTF001_032569 [Ficus carica]|uniref:Uncharacterized protein n=1 Tax=Ficus carica TaxID=3494 RepID=A0AA88DXB9_FICCA|nr:hypothetical protein TIFTF001_032569 [Ficus carica]